jgi:hypothetical protein
MTFVAEAIKTSLPPEQHCDALRAVTFALELENGFSHPQKET